MNHDYELPFITKGQLLIFFSSKEISKSAGLGKLETLKEEEEQHNIFK